MNETTLERFTEDLHAHGGATLGPHVLAEVKRRGARRRRTRAAIAGLTTAVVLGGAAALVVPLVTDDSAPERLLDVATRPSGLSALQKRVLRDVPGATRISTWQVAVPEPQGARESFPSGGGDFEVQGESFATGVTSYAGVTAYQQGTFPDWLHDAILASEAAAGDENGQPVGSTDMGIAVEDGELELACVSFQGGDCAPAVVRVEDGKTSYEWGFGTDRFLEPGTGMEVFSGDASAADAPTLVVAGLPDASVTRAEFINTAGEVIVGTVDHTMAPGSSILWAKVPGALARVVAYDTDGQVVDDHTLRACSGGVDCEVR